MNLPLRFSQFRVNIASGIASSAAGVVVTALTYPLYLRYLGYESYGLWLLLSTILTFSQLGNLGISQAMAKEVAEANASGDIDAIKECVTNATFLLLTSGAFIFISLTIFKNNIVQILHLSGAGSNIAATLLPYVAALSVYVFIVDATSATLAGLGRMDLCNYNQLASQVLTAGLSILLLAAGAGLRGLLVASIVSYFGLQIASILAIRKIVKCRIFSVRSLSNRRMKDLVGFGLSLTAGSVLAMILNPINKFVLAKYAGLSSVPIYDLSFTGGMRIRNLFDSSQRAFVPEISRLLAYSPEKAYAHARRLNRRSLLAILWLAPAYGALVAATPFLLRVWLGSRLDPSSPFTVRIMLCGTFASLAGMSAYYTLVGIGRARSILTANVIQLALNVALIFAHLSVFSTVTAANVVVSTSIGMACSSAYLIWSSARATRYKAPVAPRGEIPELVSLATEP